MEQLKQFALANKCDLIVKSLDAIAMQRQIWSDDNIKQVRYYPDNGSFHSYTDWLRNIMKGKAERWIC